jgi:hypothetical protein
LLPTKRASHIDAHYINLQTTDFEKGYRRNPFFLLAGDSSPSP